jgi:hypothetical protein
MKRTFVCLSVALLLFITITMQAAAQPIVASANQTVARQTSSYNGAPSTNSYFRQIAAFVQTYAQRQGWGWNERLRVTPDLTVDEIFD